MKLAVYTTEEIALNYPTFQTPYSYNDNELKIKSIQWYIFRNKAWQIDFAFLPCINIS